MKIRLLAVLACLSPMILEAAEPPAGKPRVGTLPAARVLYLGNSITLHGPAPAIGWTGNWGMAASSADKDYVHRLTAEIARATGQRPEIRVRNIADFERGYPTFDVPQRLKDDIEFQADLIILAIGENAAEPTTEAARQEFAAALARLLTSLRHAGKPAIFVRGSFWPNATKDTLLRQAAADAGATFVDIAALGRDKSNAASSERAIEHAGVAGHPGDKGMQALAEALWAAIRQKGGLVAPERE